MQATNQTIRLRCDETSRNALLDANTGSTPQAWARAATQFQLGLASAGNIVTDVSNLASVTIEAAAIGNRDGARVLSGTVAGTALNAALTEATWDAGTAQHAVITLTSAQMNFLAAGVNTASYWIVVSGITTGGAPIVFGTGTLVVNDPGTLFTASTPPPNPGAYLTIDQAAAQYPTKLTPTAVMTAAYTAAPGNLVPVNATAGNVPILLPVAPADGTQVGVKVVAVSGAYGASVICGGSDVLDLVGGNTSTTLSLAHESIILQYAAATAIWTIIEHGYSLASLDGRYVMASVATLAYAASITPAAKGFLNTVNVGTLTGPLALAVPSGNPTDGQVLTLRFAQDATGGRVITWDPIYAFPQASPASTLPTAASAQYEVTFGFHAPSGKWRARGAAGPF